MKASQWLLPIPLLLLMSFLLIGPAATQSVTIDEIPHIGAGLSYLQKRDLRLNGEHPPLAKLVAALPLVLHGARADYTSVSWTFGDKFFPAYLSQWVFGESVLGRWNPRQPTVALARVPMIVLTLALGVVIYCCALRIGGKTGALLCLSAYVTAPVFLTFGPLVLTDVPLVLFSLLALWAFARLWQAPGLRTVVCFAVALAAALLTKFSAPLLLIAIALFIRWTRYHPFRGEAEETPHFRTRQTRALLGSVVLAAAIVYVVYFVFSWNQPMDVQHRIGEGRVAKTIGRALMPPWLFLRGTAMVVFTGSRPAFLLGGTHPTGLPVYFPVLLGLKSPPGFLGLLGLAIYGSALLKKTGNDHHPLIPARAQVLWRVLWIACIVFSAACLLSRLNISFRHFTLPLALLILLLAPLPAMIRRIAGSRRGTAAVMAGASAVCVFGCGLSAVGAYPHFFPYVNFLAGSVPAYRLFGDSNVDWNQGLNEVAQFAREHGVRELLIDPYALSDPSSDVPGARLWDCQIPSPENAGRWAVVSANAILESHNCRWLIPHIDQSLAGGSMYSVRLPDPIPAAGTPEGPPRESERKVLFSLPIDLRTLTVEITRHPEKLPDAYAELERRLAPTNLSDDLYPPKEPVQWPWMKKR